MAKADEITKAIAAHGMWKHRLRSAIDTGKSEWSVTQVSADNNCDFGKWLHSLPPTERNSQDYKFIIQAHSEFHKTSGKVLSLAISGKKKEAEAGLSLGSEFSNISGKLTAAMTKWKNQS